MLNSTRLSRPRTIVSWVLQLFAAVIFLQTLYFKFTGHPDSIHIFTAVGIEPWGRYLSGGAELIAGILLLVPPLAWLGAGLGASVLVGAIGAHLFTPLGISVQGDPSLFIMAVATFVACLGVLYLRRAQPLALLTRREDTSPSEETR